MPPQTFWTMTPREFFAAAGGLKPRGDAPSRRELAGLMGEAGAEAILPLKRGADGSLGVAMNGAASAPSIVFNVTATDAASFRKTEGQIAAMLARTAGRGQRQL